MLVIKAITITIPYSLRNKYTNISLPISILKPLISSLSPSSKSKGARFLSISDRINHNTTHDLNNSNLKIEDPVNILNLLISRRKNRNTIIRATS